MSKESERLLSNSGVHPRGEGGVLQPFQNHV